MKQKEKAKAGPLAGRRLSSYSFPSLHGHPSGAVAAARPARCRSRHFRLLPLRALAS